MTSTTINHPGFWEQRYQDQTTAWDLGQPAPPFVTWLQTNPTPGRLAALGCGRGEDALLFAQHGFDVLGFDFAPSAIAAATALAQKRNLKAQFLQRDIFALAPEFTNTFDYVLEHTCFCAIEPLRRSEYVAMVETILRPQGELIALFWAHNRPGGPPYGSHVDEIKTLFTQHLELISLEPVSNSVLRRQNEEYLGRFRKRRES